MPVRDAYLLSLHEPYEVAEHPVPINATIVHAATLLHPSVPQPDGGRMYRCLTEFPSRGEGEVVPLSTLTFELGGGRLWDQIGDWGKVVDAVVTPARARGCDAMPLGLPQLTAGLLGNGPTTRFTALEVGRGERTFGPADRQQHLDELAGHLRSFAAQGPFWPGDGLLPPPGDPAVMPYQPYMPRR